MKIFQLFWLVEGKWVLDEGNYNNSTMTRKLLAKYAKEHERLGQVWKIRVVNS